MRYFLVIMALLLFLLSSGGLWAKDLAVTIDDLPLVYEGRYDQAKDEAYSRKIMDALDAFQAKVTGFVTGRRVRKDYQRSLLGEFIERGNTIGNHTFNHLDLNEVSAGEYGKDIQLCEALIAPWESGAHFFRYPYLHRGDTAEKRDQVYEFLRDRGLVIAPATIFPRDWEFDAEYHEKLKAGDEKGASEVGARYLAFVREKTRYAEALAKKKAGREVPHILLIHMNVINGAFLRDILAWYKGEGWRFITLAEALQDDVYRAREKKPSRESLIWLERI
ncbi:MAG: polysaccharide deacetylase family protein [Candidatus Eremiobacteraeota bacterium]|nr:polysaccharide deacetylase family protein [Candidatus Eremiobacteraeota bacterium]